MYRINEGTIDLPAEWQDRTINVISSAMGALPGLSLTITRDDIPWGMGFDEYVEGQLEQAGQALKSFQPGERRAVNLGGTPAVEVECHWTAKQGPIHQIITTVQNGPQKALVLTASMGGRMSEGQKAEMRRIVSTLKLDKRG